MSDRYTSYYTFGVDAHTGEQVGVREFEFDPPHTQAHTAERRRPARRRTRRFHRRGGLRRLRLWLLRR